MSSILSIEDNNTPITTAMVFQEGIISIINEKTGIKFTIKEFEILDMSIFGQSLEIDKVRINIIPRLFSKVVRLR